MRCCYEMLKACLYKHEPWFLKEINAKQWIFWKNAHTKVRPPDHKESGFTCIWIHSILF